MPRAAPTSNYDGRHPEPPYKTADDERDEMIAEAVAAERERCAKLVPTNWCDPLLTGPDAPKGPLDNRGVEALLQGIQDRIRNQKE